MNLFLFILFTTSIFAQIPKMDPNKKTVCSISFTSNLQTQAIREDLTKSGDIKDWQFAELSKFFDPQKPSEDWFKKACESRISCDVLVITGHFAGTFFQNGKGEMFLESEKLREYSCKKSCEGIMRNPLEIFLFGCNTLAGKDDKDPRSPEEYFTTMVQHGMSEMDAAKAAAMRFSEAGDSFKNYMEISFHGNKPIYGFNAPAPSSPKTTPLFKDFLKKNGSFKRHFDKLVEDKLKNVVSTADVIFGDSLKASSDQCNSLDSKDERLKKVCDLLYGEKELRNKLSMVTELLLDPEKVGENLVVINQFFDELKKKHLISVDGQETDGSLELLMKEPEFQLLMSNNVLKTQLLNATSISKDLNLQTEAFKLARHFRFINDEEAKRFIQPLLEKNLGTNQYASEILQNLCETHPCVLEKISHPKLLTTDMVYSLPRKLESVSPEVEAQMLKVVSSNSPYKADVGEVLMGIRKPGAAIMDHVDKIIPTITNSEETTFYTYAHYVSRTAPSSKGVAYLISGMAFENKAGNAYSALNSPTVKLTPKDISEIKKMLPKVSNPVDRESFEELLRKWAMD